MTASTRPLTAPGQWAAAGTLPSPCSWPGQDDNAVLLADGQVLVAGGSVDLLATVATASLYDPVGNTWAATGALLTGRRQHSVTRLATGAVLVAGGIAGPYQFPSISLATAESYDPAKKTWAATGNMTTARWGHSATVLMDGRVLVAGGVGVRSAQSTASLRSAEIYDPSTGEWTPTGSMTDARAGHPAVLLPDGRVLVVGGFLCNGYGMSTDLAFCELYDPVTGTWTPTGSMAAPRGLHQATLLADGTVLATGGDAGKVLLDGEHQPFSQWATERYDPATGRWAEAATMPSGRCWHRAVLLNSGRLLVIGGTDSACYDVGYQNALSYDPLAEVWTPVAGLSVGRYGFAVTTLTDGRVLVVGGSVRSGVATQNPGSDLLTATAEVLTP
ncbi:MAG TPA: kelch repeat-containing protein [Pseudonocardiaceae bacterium]|jgi:N-acetylneuraminic acid mutarotase|nr:kelch repeat-containing protein [Pseudonocardiaceae bacterium]